MVSGPAISEDGGSFHAVPAEENSALFKPVAWVRSVLGILDACALYGSSERPKKHCGHFLLLYDIWKVKWLFFFYGWPVVSEWWSDQSSVLSQNSMVQLSCAAEKGDFLDFSPRLRSLTSFTICGFSRLFRFFFFLGSLLFSFFLLCCADTGGLAVGLYHLHEFIMAVAHDIGLRKRKTWAATRLME